MTSFIKNVENPLSGSIFLKICALLKWLGKTLHAVFETAVYGYRLRGVVG